MKNIFTLIFVSLISVSAFAQLNFNWEVDTVELDRDFTIDLFDLASEGFDTDMDGLNDSTAYYAANHLENGSAETEFHWQFTTLAPTEWVIQMCDEELCYPASTTDRDVSIPMDYSYEFHYLIRPNGVSGSAIINMDIWPLSDPMDVRTAHFSIVGNVVTGLNELNLVEISVYPNPTSGALNIVSGSNPQFNSSSVINQSGQEIYNSYITDGLLDISHLESGNYILTLNDIHGQPLVTKPFIKN